MSLPGEITQGFASAIDDIRHNVVEQGWFGQVTTGDIGGNADDTATSPEPQPEATSSEVTSNEATSEITSAEVAPPEPQESITEMFTPPPAPEPDMEQGQEQGMEI